ncbi:hypothetical protein BB560_006496 [Smittium megazygosporum]|uniref:histidinol-phosphate transaminase n=1 Tax=Smittium megazygosporum TaxID=133381 RepID=A0A2T9Y503_9FUNG|nr:hypothetical protein BB560_006496 [Smittium megazygosporum]
MTKNIDINSIARPNVVKLMPYRNTREDYPGELFLDANESSFGPANLVSNSNPPIPASQELDPLQTNRYPDPYCIKVKERFIAKHDCGLSIDNIFIGSGSDEAIDNLTRVFCKPGVDKCLICPPTFEMYEMACEINDIEVLKIDLKTSNRPFQLQIDKVIQTLENDPLIKIVWLIAPGNPTGVALNQKDLLAILESSYKGIVAIDEAYIDFVGDGYQSMAKYVSKYNNLVLIQTMSKSFGLAGARVGFAISSPEVIKLMNSVKTPFNISVLAQNAAFEALSPESIKSMRRIVSEINHTRDEILVPALEKMPNVKAVLGSGATNFILVQFCSSDGTVSNDFTKKLYEILATEFNVLLRNRAHLPGCYGSLRISIGTRDEMYRILEALEKAFEKLNKE